MKNEVPDDSSIIISLPKEILLYEQTKAELVCEFSNDRDIDSQSVECQVEGNAESRYVPEYVSEIRVTVDKNVLQRGVSS